MARRKRYKDGAPIEWEYANNGAPPHEKRWTTEQAAEALGVQKQTLFRWWKLLKLPEPEGDMEAYMPDLMFKGDQMTLQWPDSVVEKLRELLTHTSRVAGEAGLARLPPKPGSASIQGGASARYKLRKAAAEAIQQRAEMKDDDTE